VQVSSHARLFLLLSVLAGCSDQGPGSSASITLNPDSIVVEVDSSVGVRVIARSEDGQRLPDAAIGWHIFDTTIARLSAPGTVVGVSVGLTALIVASDSAQKRVPVTTVVRLARVSMGVRKACALTATQAIYCWGIDQGYPALLSTALHATVVSTGDSHGCALNTAGRAYCWGNGPLGDGAATASDSAVAVAGGLTFASIGAGYFYSCARTSVGKVYCWGDGYDDVMGGQGPYLTPQQVPGLTAAVLTAGGAHACALDAAGQASCWGYNEYGQLGSNANTYTCSDPCSRTPAPVGNLPALKSIVANDYHTCALTVDGLAYCWGSNAGGKLGIGDSTGSGCIYSSFNPGFPCSDRPVAVAGGLHFASLALGSSHTCGLTDVGDLYCWGDNGAGQFGVTFPDYSLVPVPAANGRRFSSITAAYGVTCGMGLDRVAYCWGSDWFNTLGNGSVRNDSRSTPTRILFQP
jgi:hypothetical protein